MACVRRPDRAALDGAVELHAPWAPWSAHGQVLHANSACGLRHPNLSLGRKEGAMHIIVSMKTDGRIVAATTQGHILAECFLKAEDETADELRQMGYARRLPTYAAATIEAGPGLEAADLERIFPPDFGQRRTISMSYLNSCSMM